MDINVPPKLAERALNVYAKKNRQPDWCFWLPASLRMKKFNVYCTGMKTKCTLWV